MKVLSPRSSTLQKTLSSVRNPRIQAARDLKRGAVRRRENAFLIEGPHAVLDALASDARIREIFVTEGSEHIHDVVERGREHGVDVVRVTDGVMTALSDTSTPQGVVAVADSLTVRIADLPRDASLVLALAAVRDPGNAGTLLRSAVAAGADGVIFAGDSVDPLGPKTVRASAGAVFHTVVIAEKEVIAALRELRDRGILCIGAEARAARSLYDVDLTRPVAFVIGNEAWGLPREIADVLDDRVAIPMRGPSESLNVAVAGSIMMFEALRQRDARG